MANLQALYRGDLPDAREVRLPGLSEFPKELFGLSETLEILDIGGGSLTALPDDFGRFRKLRVLFCSGNKFKRLPPVLGDCASLTQISFRGTGMHEVPGEALPPLLRWLIITDNFIEQLPGSIGERPHLQKLMVAGNRLKKLPESLANAEALELVRLGSNQLAILPSWLANLPSLAWVSWAGNAIEQGFVPLEAASVVHWRDLEIGEIVGEGTSGRVHRASWHVDAVERPRPVALKIFKGAMTSDGLPEREIATCLAAGEHPNLTAALGRVVDHPSGLDALVMPLLPAHWRALAGPPSLLSCTRDIYDPMLRLNPEAALRIAQSVAAATAHLHSRGLLHGDVYAHNTLWDGEAGEAALSDFGATSILPAGEDKDAWCRIEVRAWGLLLGELLDHCTEPLENWERLRELESACVQEDVCARPLMADVINALSSA